MGSMVTGDYTAAGRARAEPLVAARQAASKVPQITVFFWIIKILTTAQGEATSDWAVYRIDPVLAVGIAGLALVAALALQFRARKYVAWIYWLTVDLVAIFGTMAADGMHIKLGIPYAVSSAFFAALLFVVLVSWYATEKTLSIHSIRTRRREVFYWATVLSTFALGTALGDMTATTLHLGYLTSGIMFTLIFAVPAVAHRWLRLNAIAAFWFAYIVTRRLVRGLDGRGAQRGRARVRPRERGHRADHPDHRVRRLPGDQPPGRRGAGGRAAAGPGRPPSLLASPPRPSPPRMATRRGVKFTNQRRPSDLGVFTLSGAILSITRPCGPIGLR